MDYLLDTGTLQRSDLYAQAMRLAFHDAGEVDVHKCYDNFGSDGCLSSQGSAGLIEKEAFSNVFIEPIWQSICDRISRADFWALFGTIAVERAARFAISLTFQYGRRDNVHCEGGAGRLPSAQGGLEELQRIFVDQMGLTMSDAGKTMHVSINYACVIRNHLFLYGNAKCICSDLIGRALSGPHARGPLGVWLH